MNATTILIIGAALVALIWMHGQANVGPTGTHADNIDAQAHAAADPGVAFWAAATHTPFHGTDELATPTPSNGLAVEASSGVGHFVQATASGPATEAATGRGHF